MEVKVEEGVESGAENVLVCVEASAVLKAATSSTSAAKPAAEVVVNII